MAVKFFFRIAIIGLILNGCNSKALKDNEIVSNTYEIASTILEYHINEQNSIVVFDSNWYRDTIEFRNLRVMSTPFGRVSFNEKDSLVRTALDSWKLIPGELDSITSAVLGSPVFPDSILIPFWDSTLFQRFDVSYFDANNYSSDLFRIYMEAVKNKEGNSVLLISSPLFNTGLDYCIAASFLITDMNLVSRVYTFRRSSEVWNMETCITTLNEIIWTTESKGKSMMESFSLVFKGVFAE